MLIPDYYEFLCPTKINAGNRALDHIPYELETMNARAPLVVCAESQTGSDPVQALIQAFRSSGLTLRVFRCSGNPATLASVVQIAEIYKNKNCDALISLGCGPVTETAKAVNLLVSTGSSDFSRFAGKDRVGAPLKPFILVADLNWQGDETASTISVDGITVCSYSLMPALVVIDPRTVAAVPPQVLLSTGMIALTQAMAGLLGTAANPMVETYAQAATGYIVENLGVAIEHPHAGSERIAVASGAAVAGAVRANMDAGIVYPLARLLGSVCDTAVGILAGILLPHSFTLNRFKQQALNQLLLPLAGFDAFARTPPGKRLSGAVEYVRDFQQQMFGLAGRNIPATLRDTGLSRDLLEDVSAQVMANSENKDDCRDCLTILEKAW